MWTLVTLCELDFDLEDSSIRGQEPISSHLTIRSSHS